MHGQSEEDRKIEGGRKRQIPRKRTRRISSSWRRGRRRRRRRNSLFA